METRLKRYLTLRKKNSKLPRLSQTTDDLISFPYETTHKGRTPVLSADFRKTDTLRTKGNMDSLAAQAIPYEQAVAGTPPIFGATPLKGNGPIKLQTSRRLSSGEVLVTSPDHQRTLSDLRDGEYVIGRKDLYRTSKTVSIKVPLQNSVSSPRASLALAPPLSDQSSQQSPKPQRNHNFSRPITADKDRHTIEAPTPDRLARSLSNRNSSAIKPHVPSPSEIPFPLSPGRPRSATTSLLSKGEEQNATIQALWKAEYARLVTMYGQDGVDRNIAELNKDHFNFFQSAASGGASRPYSDTIIPTPLKSPRGSDLRQIPSVDSVSEYSSNRVPSLLASEESSSSCTKRTSLLEADVPTTREEVSRIVETMRKNYLKALEARAEQKPKAKRQKKSKQRASYTHGVVAAPSALSKSAKEARQSWQASTVPNAPRQEKQTKRRTSSKSTDSRDSMMHSLKATTSKSTLKSKPSLQRADSTTLGTFFGSKRDHPRTPSPTRTLNGAKAERSERSAGMSQVDDRRPPTTESASSVSLADNIAPEIEDFDIFYQDLTRDVNAKPSHVKPSIPGLLVRHQEQMRPRSGDGAPPPPDIDWAPHSRGVLTVR